MDGPKVVPRKPEEFVISREDLSNPFAVFGKPKAAAKVEGGGMGRGISGRATVLEEEKTNK